MCVILHSCLYVHVSMRGLNMMSILHALNMCVLGKRLLQQGQSPCNGDYGDVIPALTYFVSCVIRSMSALASQRFPEPREFFLCLSLSEMSDCAVNSQKLISEAL